MLSNQRLSVKSLIIIAVSSISPLTVDAHAQSKGDVANHTSLSYCWPYQGVEVMEDYRLRDPVDLLNYKLEARSNIHYYVPDHEGMDVRLNSEANLGVGYNRAMSEEARRSQHFQHRAIESPNNASKLTPKLHITIPLTENKNNR